MSIEQAASDAAPVAGSAAKFRIEYFRDGVLIKACPSHRSKGEAIEAAAAGLAAHNAQLAIIRDCHAGNVEVARLKREG
ncbi:MAG TPA: hypothetical protein VKB94_01115 [Rhizomicrobium sp.]|nr:hypothetical protein [Rhizomicrobium sp.]